MLLTAADLIVNGPVDAIGGTGGIANGNGGNGGSGSIGRTWLAENNSISGSVNENPNTTLIARGNVFSANSTFTMETPVIDIKNSAPMFTAESFTQSLAGASTSSVQYASSDSDSFTPSWKSLASLTDDDKKRYWKFRIEIAQDSSTDFSTISLIDLTYDPKLESDFDLVGACGILKAQKPNKDLPIYWMYLLALPLLLWSLLRFRKLPIYF
jgi:hypothetical protein